MSNHNERRLLVSVITITLNSEKYISDTVQSIVSQSYPYIEHIVIDGASKDRTVAIVKELNPKAVIISEPDSGPLEAANKGLSIAKGDIIAFLHSDDYYANERIIQKVVDTFISNESVKVLYGIVQAVDSADGKIIMRHGRPVTSKDFGLKYMKAVLEFDIMPGLALFARKELYDTVGLFSSEYAVIADGEYNLRVIKLYKPFFLNEVITIMRSGGISSQNVFKAHKAVYKLLRRENVRFIDALGYYFYCCIRTFFSKLFLNTRMRGVFLLYLRIKGQF